MHIYGDGEAVIDGITGNSLFQRTGLQGWIGRINFLLNKLHDPPLKHIYWELNTRVDSLSKCGLESPFGSITVLQYTVVDLLMWKKKKKSAIFLSLGTVIWVLFEWFEYHVVTLSCLVILAYMVAVIFYNDVATSISGFPLPPIPRINVPEEAIFNVASVIRAEANRFSDFIYEVSSDVSSVRQAKRFILVVACVSVVSVISSWCNFLTLLYSCSVAAFTVPKLYDRYQVEIDRLLNNATLEIKQWYSQISGQIDGVRDNAKLAITKRYIQILEKFDQVRQLAREEMKKLYLQISERVRVELKRQYEWVADKASLGMNQQYRLFDNGLLTKILRSRVKSE